MWGDFPHILYRESYHLDGLTRSGRGSLLLFSISQIHSYIQLQFHRYAEIDKEYLLYDSIYSMLTQIIPSHKLFYSIIKGYLGVIF